MDRALATEQEALLSGLLSPVPSGHTGPLDTCEVAADEAGSVAHPERLELPTF